MLSRRTAWSALATVLLAAALVAAPLQANAQAPAPGDDGSSPVASGAASIVPQWTYGEKPAVGSRQPVTAEPKVDRPDTTPCTVQLFTDRKFVPRDGAPPQDYSYTPSADCAGPWSKVVLESDFHVDPEAALYDKTAQLFLGGVTIYYGTTMGPGRYCENYPEWTVPTAALPTCPTEPKLTPQWHEENDVTEYSALFTNPQSGKVHLDNDAYITSYYLPADSILDAGLYMSAKLVFYPVAPGAVAPVVADDVRSLDPATDEGAVIWNDSQALSYTFTDLPRNLERVYLDVQREGQRGDEFYNTSTNSAAGGRGVREFEVKVDGQPAGVVPAYPYKYTYSNGGGYQNRNWAPVPAVSAFNFITYRVDLSPFAGVLSDGNSHTVSINGYNLPNSATARTCVFANVTTRFGIPATGCGYGPGGNGYVLTGGSFWYVMGNLVLYRDHGAETTSGEVTQNTLTAVPTLEVNTTSPRRAVATHDYVLSGYVNTSHGKVVTTLDQKIKIDTNITNATSTAVNQLTSYVAKTTVTNGDDTSTTTVNLNYIDQNGTFRADGLNTSGWTYAAQTEHNGNAGGWVNISDLYSTVPSSNLAQQQYVASDSSGNCYDRVLKANIPQRQPSIASVSDGIACSGIGDGHETITVTITEAPGEFSWMIDADDHSVVLGASEAHDDYYESTGAIKPVKITDTRAGKPSWTMSGQLGDFSGGLSGKYLGWAPTVVSAGAGAVAGPAVAAGLTSGNGLKAPSVLGSAADGHVKGSGTVGADLDLRAPIDTDPGTYTATLTLTALG